MAPFLRAVQSHAGTGGLSGGGRDDSSCTITDAFGRLLRRAGKLVHISQPVQALQPHFSDQGLCRLHMSPEETIALCGGDYVRSTSASLLESRRRQRQRLATCRLRACRWMSHRLSTSLVSVRFCTLLAFGNCTADIVRLHQLRQLPTNRVSSVGCSNHGRGDRVARADEVHTARVFDTLRVEVHGVLRRVGHVSL